MTFFKCQCCEFEYNTRLLWGLCPKCFVTDYEDKNYLTWDDEIKEVYIKEVNRAKLINPMGWKMPEGMYR